MKMNNYKPVPTLISYHTENGHAILSSSCTVPAVKRQVKKMKYKLYLPSITVGNVSSLVNKTDKLAALARMTLTATAHVQAVCGLSNQGKCNTGPAVCQG